MVAKADIRIHEVDVLRGLAALTVVFSHYFPHWHRYANDVPVLVPGAFGFYAVQLFFVISGFVIFLTLERCRTVADFAVLRFSRLYPAYWASLLLVLAIGVLAFGDPVWLGGIATNVTMFQQFLGYPNLDNVYWSLTVELAFYINVAWLFALGLHRKMHWVIFVWLALTSVWVTAGHGVGRVTALDVVDTHARDPWALLFALDYAPYLAMGMLFYRAKRYGWTLPTAALIAMAVGVEFLLASWEGVAVASLIGLVFGLAVTGRLRFAVGRVTLWFGAISYSLYLVHRNLGYHSLDWLHAHSIAGTTAIAITTVGALLLATLLAYGVERPASTGMRSWYRRLRRGGMFQGSTQ